MRNVKWLLAAGLIAATTAACTTDSGYYPNTSYNRGYNTNAYYSTTSCSTPQRRGPNGDYDRDGIPNRYDRDANGDGVADRRQR